jgi:prephenate dehydrogenase
VEKALSLGMIDEAADSPKSAAEGAELVVLATPISAIRDTLCQIAGSVPSGCVVTDVGSAKGEIMQWAEECLPQEVSFIGGHPMAGKETGCTDCLVPGSNTDPESVQSMMELVHAIDAKPLLIDAQEHDDFVAAISHMPFIVSAALASVTTKNDKWARMSQLASSGYRDTTRLASQSPDLGRDMCVTNQASILRWVDRFLQEVRRFRDTIAMDPEAVDSLFREARRGRQQWLEEHDQEG